MMIKVINTLIIPDTVAHTNLNQLCLILEALHPLTEKCMRDSLSLHHTRLYPPWYFLGQI